MVRELSRQKAIGLLESNAVCDRLLLSVPPKYSIAMTIGYLKGKRKYGTTGPVVVKSCHKPI